MGESRNCLRNRHEEPFLLESVADVQAKALRNLGFFLGGRQTLQKGARTMKASSLGFLAVVATVYLPLLHLK